MGSSQSVIPSGWVSKRTHNGGDVDYYTNAQAARHAAFLNECSNALNLLNIRKAYMGNDYINATLNTINSHIVSVRDNHTPTYINAVDTYTYFISWWRKRTGYTYNLNLNFYTQMDALSAAINTIKQNIASYTEGNCDNPYTLIPVDPNSQLSNCSVPSLESQFKTSIAEKKQLSQSVVDTLTPENPQYNTAVAVNNTLSNFSNWDWRVPLFSSDTRFSQNGLSAINDTYEIMLSSSEPLYNTCTYEQTLISNDATGTPNCLKKEYDLASNTCGKAKSQSQIYNYSKGTDTLTALWSSVTNAIQGNTLEADRTILSNAQNSCNKWVQMFNLWEKLEEEAAATPCEPERAIQTTYDPVMLKIAEDWNRSATLYIESLMKRLAIIQKYIETYPNILQLDKNDVTFGPSSLGAAMQMKYKVNQITPGVAPVQYLEMLVPNGSPGKQGQQGEPGIPGFDGKSGPKGSVGQTGNPTLPTSYN
jgi:hypothetical protein